MKLLALLSIATAALISSCSPPCGPQNCAGCCDATGFCALGQTTDACRERHPGTAAQLSLSPSELEPECAHSEGEFTTDLTRALHEQQHGIIHDR